MTDDDELHKADFGAIYDQPDPRAYFTTLERYDYQIPQHGADVFARLLRERTPVAGPAPTVVDVCCSYGVIGSLLKTDLVLDDLYGHYRAPEVASSSPEDLVELDRRLLREHGRSGAARVVGLDVAENAVAYALAIGAIDGGGTENLEETDVSPQLAELLSGVDLITTTGGIGYVTELTFDRLLAAAPASAWVAAFCLRTYDYGPIAEVMRARGMRTERVPRTFRQRNFTSSEEQEWALAEVRSRGLDPAGAETDGHYHAELYVSRPAEQVEARPLTELLTMTT